MKQTPYFVSMFKVQVSKFCVVKQIYPICTMHSKSRPKKVNSLSNVNSDFEAGEYDQEIHEQ